MHAWGDAWPGCVWLGWGGEGMYDWDMCGEGACMANGVW